MAKQASRKPSVAKKPAAAAVSRGRALASTKAATKGKPAAKAVVVAKSKVASAPSRAVVPSRPVAPARAVAASRPAAKSNGHAPKIVASKSIVASKTAVKAPPMKLKDREPKRPLPPPMPIPEAVPTNGKPRKNQAGLLPRELEHFRDLLLEKRRELVGDMYSMESEALRTGGSSNLSTLPIHMADMGTDNYEQEFTLGLVEKDRGLLREINTALAKIQNGTYGICEGTGKPISKPRLEAQPWARHSIEYARQMQRPMGGGRIM